MFQQFFARSIVELRPWNPGEEMENIFVAPDHARSGSPEPGDLVARNPDEPAKQWLVPGAFAGNYQPI